MADATFDVVIVGGGHNGLSLALYLLNAGLTVGIFERKNEIGGGCDTMELSAPGFWGNLHSWGHQHLMGAKENFPAYHDFDIEDKYGVRYVDGLEKRDANGKKLSKGRGACFAFPDGKVITGQYSDLKHISQKDADTLRRWMDLFEGSEREHVLKWLYSPPVPLGQRSPLQDFAQAMGISDMDYAYYNVMSPVQICEELFESKEVRCQFVHTMWGLAFPPNAAGMGFMGIILSLLMIPSKYHCVGGSHNLVHGLQRALHHLGGKSYTKAEVDKIIIENGAARGVRLQDGSVIRAKKAVVSAVDAAQTMLRFVGKEHLNPRTVRRIENMKYGSEALVWPQIALHEAPKYTLPALADATVVSFGPPSADPNAYLRSQCEYDLGRFTEGWWPMMVWVDSQYDETMAPKGKFFAGGQIQAPRASAYTPKEWLEWKKKGPAEWMKRWAQYAPNMTMDNVIAFDFFHAWDVEKRTTSMKEGGWVLADLIATQAYRFRPIPELSDYRTPIKDLYMCSNCMPTVPTGATGVPGYCCYKVMAGDYGLPKVWEEKGRSY